MAQRISLEFLQKIISQSEKDAIVTHFQNTPGSGRGDNYTAMLYRIKLEGYKINTQNNTKEIWTKSLIYKCLPDNYARREAFKSDSLFRNEVSFYTTVMPSLLNYQKSKPRIKHPFKSIPHCYYAKSDVLVLEDMCVKGFKMGDRKLGLNFEQCKAVLIELAKFHALSLAFKVEHHTKFQSLLSSENSIRESYFIKDNEEWYRSYYNAVRHNALVMVQEALSQNENSEIYIQKFSEFVDESFYYRMMSLVKPNEPLAVFCHGDCWTNNILFSMVDDKIHDVCMVDFQLCRYASPGLDLANLIYCCTTRQLRDCKLGALLTEYITGLNNFLSEIFDEEFLLNSELLQRNILSSLIEKEFKRCGLFGLGLALDMIPISTCDSEQAPDLYDEDEERVEDGKLEQIGVCPVWTSNESCKKKMVNLVCELVDGDIL